MKKLLKLLFNVNNIGMHKQLTLFGLKFSWLDKNKFFAYQIEELQKQILNNFQNQEDFIRNSSLNLTSNCEEFTKDITNKLNSLCYQKNIISKLEDMQNKFIEIQKSNFVEFVFKNIDNPYYAYLYNDLYKIFSVGEYYTMKDIYIKRINKYKIDQNINKLLEKNSYVIYLLTDLEESFDKCQVISIDDIKAINKSDDTIFLIAYNQDYLAINAIKELQKLNAKYYALEQYGTPQARYYHINEYAYKTLIEEFNNKPLKHFCPGDFENIFQAIEATKNLDGDFVEIGTFQGASAHATLNYLSKIKINRKCYFIDTYEGFTYEEAQTSEDMLWKNSHIDTSIERVREYLSDYDNFELIKANIIQEELPDNVKNICVANIDVDMYDAVKSALYKVKDRIVKNGIIIAEDYGHTPALIGAQKATDEFLEENPNEFIPIYLHSGQMLLIKK